MGLVVAGRRVLGTALTSTLLRLSATTLGSSPFLRLLATWLPGLVGWGTLAATLTTASSFASGLLALFLTVSSTGARRRSVPIVQRWLHFVRLRHLSVQWAASWASCVRCRAVRRRAVGHMRPGVSLGLRFLLREVNGLRMTSLTTCTFSSLLFPSRVSWVSASLSTATALTSSFSRLLLATRLAGATGLLISVGFFFRAFLCLIVRLLRLLRVF